MVESTSDTVSSIAGKLLQAENPLQNDEKLSLLAARLVDLGWNTNKSSQHAVADLRRALTDVIGDPFAEYRSIAGSALTQDPKKGPNE